MGWAALTRQSPRRHALTIVYQAAWTRLLSQLMTGQIIISALNIDDEDIQFQVRIENYYCKTSLDFYGYADDFKEFGHKLSEFPKSISDTVAFQIGEDDRKWAYYMFIKAFCYDALGHTALRIVVDNFGDNVYGHRSEFSINSEAASINLLGQILMNWNPHVTKEIIWESITS
jgi:hypothetical protein